MATYKELLAQRDALERQIEAARNAERSEALTQVRTLIAEFALTATECGFSTTSGKKRGTVVQASAALAAKYIGPQGERWSGRGRTPKWLDALEAQGRSRNEFAVA